MISLGFFPPPKKNNTMAALELQLLPLDIVEGVAQLEQFMIHGLRFVDVRSTFHNFAVRFFFVERSD